MFLELQRWHREGRSKVKSLASALHKLLVKGLLISQVTPTWSLRTLGEGQVQW